jgi:hypothetical protein
VASSAKKVATYQDVLDAPPYMVAEIVGGELHLTPRPAKPHAADPEAGSSCSNRSFISAPMSWYPTWLAGDGVACRS